MLFNYQMKVKNMTLIGVSFYIATILEDQI